MERTLSDAYKIASLVSPIPEGQVTSWLLSGLVGLPGAGPLDTALNSLSANSCGPVIPRHHLSERAVIATVGESLGTLECLLLAGYSRAELTASGNKVSAGRLLRGALRGVSVERQLVLRRRLYDGRVVPWAAPSPQEILDRTWSGSMVPGGQSIDMRLVRTHQALASILWEQLGDDPTAWQVVFVLLDEDELTLREAVEVVSSAGYGQGPRRLPGPVWSWYFRRRALLPAGALARVADGCVTRAPPAVSRGVPPLA